MGLTLQATDLRQVFNRRTIFSRVSFTLKVRDTLLIAGRNGSGKSTLVKILCGVLTPTGGRVTIDGDGARDQFARKARIGMVAPYLQVYEEFSALENLHLSMAMRGYPADGEAGRALLERVALDPDRKDPVRGFSSGMKQRLKYAMALIHHPSILVLDEPMSNLDADGTAIVRSVMDDHRTRGILVVATNDLTDIDRWDAEVNLNDRD